MLHAGGNAIDAGVAMGVCLNVLVPDQASFGGVAPILVYLAQQRRVVSVSGLGSWPSRATVERVLELGGGGLPPGVLRSVVPAAPDAWLTVLERYGRLSLAQVLAPAIELAEEGFPVYRTLASSLRVFGETFKRWPSSLAQYWPRGRPPVEGEVLVQPDLGRTLRRLVEAEAGSGGDRASRIRAARDRFYRGDIAGEIAAFVRQQGGLLDEQDLAAFSVDCEASRSTSYAGYQVHTNDFWCQGPVLLQALNILEGFDLPALGLGSADFIHTVAEAFNLAFADREAHYGDPRHVEVPAETLLSKEYAATRRALLDPARAFGRLAPAGDPYGSGTSPVATPAARPGPHRADTTCGCVIDAEGNAFAATPSDTLDWSPIVPGLGFSISGRGVQSRLEPGHPAAIGPGRRPRLTPAPALVCRGDEVAMVVNTPGGDVQCQTILQAFLGSAVFGLPPQVAIEQPRFGTFSFPNSFYPYAYRPGLLRLEGRVPQAVAAELRRRGHVVEPWADWDPTAGACCMVVRAADGSLAAGADPRRYAYAAGW